MQRKFKNCFQKLKHFSRQYKSWRSFVFINLRSFYSPALKSRSFQVFFLWNWKWGRGWPGGARPPPTGFHCHKPLGHNMGLCWKADSPACHCLGSRHHHVISILLVYNLSLLSPISECKVMGFFFWVPWGEIKRFVGSAIIMDPWEKWKIKLLVPSIRQTPESLCLFEIV